MTRDEAIAILREEREGICTDVQCAMTMYRDYSGVDKCNRNCEEREAYDMAIEALQAEPKTKCVARIEVDTEEIVKRIKEEYDITDGWIPVSERLPNKNEWEYYLVTIKGYRLFVDVAPFDNKVWKGLSSSQEVLAWMPLPKPYREDGEA